MYYDCVEIKPDGKGGWYSIHYQQKGDRLENCTAPSAYGFYHYPREWGIEKGFQTLKNTMIERHEKEIEQLTSSLNALRLVELPESTPTDKGQRTREKKINQHEDISR